MKKLLIIFLSILSYYSVAQTLPKLTDLVTDNTGTLSQTELQKLKAKLLAYNDSTSSQVAILIVSDYSGYEAMDYTIRVAEKSEIGQKGKDNGVLISVAMDERKMAIATGYGLEDRITDAATSTIREEYMKPAFREGKYYLGLDRATSIIFDLAAGKYKADAIAKESNNPGLGVGALIFIFILFTILSKIGRIRRHHMGGGSLDFITLMMLLGSGYRHSGSYRDFNSGGGSFGGGGGFSGFGGGSFGGGGSSGSW